MLEKKEAEIKVLNEKLFPGLMNNSTVCFFNVAFQALAFIDFSNLFGLLNINEKNNDSKDSFFPLLSEYDATESKKDVNMMDEDETCKG